MSLVSDESMHLVVTSPPYWQLKDYGDTAQIGFDESYESYINNLNLVWSECYRALAPGCRMAVNVGDQFARAVYYGRYKVIPIRVEIIKFAESIGFDYMGAIIWQKKTTMNTTGGASVMGSFPYPRNGIIEIDYEFILLFKKRGKEKPVPRHLKEQAGLTKDEWKEYFSGHWYFNGERQKGHLAMFPEELPKRLIKMFTFPSETVLDPFAGSGTTLLAAKNLGRNSVGYEINAGYLPLMKQKLGAGQMLLDGCTLSVEHDGGGSGRDSSARIGALPYVFKDLVGLKKQVDPRVLSFGSRVSADQPQSARNLHSVREIAGPAEVILDSGVRVRLMGVAELPGLREKAVQFLRLKTAGQRVVLKFDTDKYDASGTLQAYVYLKNRTFLNAHLIKRGLVTVDTSRDFLYKTRFEALVREITH
jgi:site-specific DNA-methyltransferase (adenine-specific)